MLLKKEIKIGKVYAFDIHDMYVNSIPETITVKLHEIKKNSCIVESMQTHDIFKTEKSALTTLKRCRKMFKIYQQNKLNTTDRKYKDILSKLAKLNFYLAYNEYLPKESNERENVLK